jgi:hypothetical protein
MQTKFISWLIENPEIHQILASQWLELQASDLLHVLDQLHEGGFYDIMYTIIMQSTDDSTIRKTMDQFIFHLIAEKLEQVGPKQMYADFKKLLSENSRCINKDELKSPS